MAWTWPSWARSTSARSPSTRGPWPWAPTGCCERPRPWRAPARPGSTWAPCLPRPTSRPGSRPIRRRIDSAERLACSPRGSACRSRPIPAAPPRPGPPPTPAPAPPGAGRGLINDVSGLHADPALAGLVAEAGAGLVLMASPADGAPLDALAEPIAIVREALGSSLARARAAGIQDERILLAPGIGFFRGQPIAWPDWVGRVLADLPALRALGRPLHVGVSRKSFIG